MDFCEHGCLLTEPGSPDMVDRNESQDQIEGFSARTEAETSLLQTIRLFIPVLETEPGSCQDQLICSCQDAMTFADYTAYTD